MGKSKKRKNTNKKPTKNLPSNVIKGGKSALKTAVQYVTKEEFAKTLGLLESFRRRFLSDLRLLHETIRYSKSSTYSQFVNLNALIEYLNEKGVIDKEDYKNEMNRLIVQITGIDNDGVMHGKLNRIFYQHGQESHKEVVHEID